MGKVYDDFVATPYAYVLDEQRRDFLYELAASQTHEEKDYADCATLGQRLVETLYGEAVKVRFIRNCNEQGQLGYEGHYEQYGKHYVGREPYRKPKKKP